MKMHNECLLCLFKQILEVGKNATDDRKKIKELLDIYAVKIPEINFDKTPPEICEKIYKDIKLKLDTTDPYVGFKKKHMQVAHQIYPHAQQVIKDSEEKIKTALLLAATGNSIDAGISNNIDIETILKKDVKNGFVINHINRFIELITNSKELLIIADNSGEGYFDKILIEELKQLYNIKVYYAVRNEPILNDITLKEANEIGINEVAHLIDSGSKAPGIILEEATEEFENIFNNVDIIISKGQGNYETLSEKNIDVFYLLKAKCQVIAHEFGIKKGGLIFKESRKLI